MPPGHGGGLDGDLPPGQPPSKDPGLPPQNTSKDDPSVPKGTILVEIRDAEDRPVGDQDIVLGIVENSIAKGESRKRLSQKTSALGNTSFSGLDLSATNAYRVSTTRDGASSAAPPFQLPQNAGMRVVLYVFPVARTIKEATIAMQSITYIELRDEILQVEQAYRIYNIGRSSWLPIDTSVTLPAGFKAFTSQKAMSDIAWDGGKSGASLRGTIPPGLHETAFRFQVPNEGSEEMIVEFGILPNVQSARVLIESPKGMTLEIDGFPPAVSTTNGEGQRILFTEKSTDRLDAGFRTVRVRIGGLPVKSKGRWYALALASVALAGGVYAAGTLRRQKGIDPEEMLLAKQRILEEIRALDRAFSGGEVGPKTHERDRAVLMETLARLIAQESGSPPSKGSPLGTS